MIKLVITKVSFSTNVVFPCLVFRWFCLKKAQKGAGSVIYQCWAETYFVTTICRFESCSASNNDICRYHIHKIYTLNNDDKNDFKKVLH